LDNRGLKIAIDAMGGDLAPQNEVTGAVQALREADNRFEVVFVGRQKEIQDALDRHHADDVSYSIVHATEVINMHDVPLAALKAKKDSSIVVGMTLLRKGTVDAIVSVGNTGAVMAASTLILGRIEGISRPTIGAAFPTESGMCVLIDAGASVDCKPRHLLEFAVMGSLYAKEIFKCNASPRVGLLNIGEEAVKGDELTQKAYALLSRSSLNFIGNIEGKDVLRGKADVVVCDGFVGNVVLKFAESMFSVLKGKFRSYADKGMLQKLWMWMMSGTLRRILKVFDYQEHGGVPLLGVNGVAIIGHGSSTPKAIKNMIFKAEEMVNHRINERIQEAIATFE
jgi:glycerol-3-phosphate acyltransferase PlsX